jgi:predicted O-methyltransferase YrrM
MRPTRFLFGSAIFLASFLLFLVEPMAAKVLLPTFGGSAAVWVTCLVFFQAALLCAYLYAHWLGRLGNSRQSKSRWAAHYLLLLVASAAAVLVLLPQASQSAAGYASGSPVLSIFVALAGSIGLPFLMLGATSPLLQVWIARVESGAVPYRLFALSNFASLLALALYPVWIEPNIPLHTQRILWTGGFLCFTAISAGLTWITRTATAPPAIETAAATPLIEEESPATLWHKCLWVALPMGAAMQLSAVTSHITQNIAAIPLLWIVPLAVYLITLILAFEFPRLHSRWLMTRLLAVLLAGLGYMLTKPDGSLPLKLTIGFFAAELLVGCLFLHAEAYAIRPLRKSETTLFYLLFAAGGALGSFLIGIASPLIFRFNYDLAISFFVTALLAACVLWNSAGPKPVRWGIRLLWTSASGMMLVLVFFLNVAYQRDTPVAVRNFYGSLRVKQIVGYPGATIRTLTNGTIEHGTQIFSDDLRAVPTTYYAPDSGVGLAMHACCTQGTEKSARRIGVIGLGAGTMAAYGQAGDRLRFYEINPAVAPIARHLFTYMTDAEARGAEITIVDGDARTSLAAELAEGHPQQFDVLVVDAFSGDAIPLHLLTTQALELYKRHLAPGGVIAFHISNQHVDLEPVVAALAKAAGMQTVRVSSLEDAARGEFTATWMLVSGDPAFFRRPEIFNNASKAEEKPGLRVWTDDYSSLLPVLHW